MRKIFVFAALLVGAIMAAPEADRVSSLPELNESLPSKHYSGYLNATGGSFLHYYAVEAIEVSPAEAPVVLWMNGGPGCSSMDGWGYELGPFHFKDYNTTGPTLKLNPHTWARIANLVFLEAPPGVGFSYREDGNYTISDSENARNNYAAVKYLFAEKFPEWKTNKFFVAGESYGGIYVPTLAYEIFTHHELTNFQGILVGNGVTSHTYDDFRHGDLAFDHGHGLISEEIFTDIIKYCYTNASRNDDKCNTQTDMYDLQTGLLNFYGAYYKCFEQPSQRWKHIPSLRRSLERQAKKSGTTVNEILGKRGLGVVPPSPPGGQVPCIDSTTMTTYLNKAEVKAALHVHSELTWSICYEINYVEDVFSVVYIWKALINAGKPVLFYSGNVDRAVPYTGTMAWIASGGWNKTHATTAWNFEDPSYPYGPQVGGLYEKYADHFTFIRVNGAGHMVPQFRPAAAFFMFKEYMTSINATSSGEYNAAVRPFALGRN